MGKAFTDNEREDSEERSYLELGMIVVEIENLHQKLNKKTLEHIEKYYSVNDN